ncbi:MAG: ABC transporter ATP-binding protein [Variovorax sp.]
MSGVTPAPALVTIDGLRFRWPRTRDDVLSIRYFELRAGETVFLSGASGSGKSTFLSLVAGVLTATEGTVCLDGQDWRILSPAARDRRRADHIGYIFQQFNLLPYLSVLENALLPCRFSPLRRQRAAESQEAPDHPQRRAAERLLRQFDLGAALWDRPATALSVGQQQRVAAARALIGAPALIVADEPTSALDEALRESFMQVLMQACSEAGSALLFVSHDARLASRFGRSVDLATLNRSASAATAPVEATA